MAIYEYSIFKIDDYQHEVIGLRMADDLPISMGGQFNISDKLVGFKNGQYKLLAQFVKGNPRGVFRKPLSDDYILTSVPSKFLEEFKNFLEP